MVLRVSGFVEVALIVLAGDRELLRAPRFRNTATSTRLSWLLQLGPRGRTRETQGKWDSIHPSLITVGRTPLIRLSIACGIRPKLATHVSIR